MGDEIIFRIRFYTRYPELIGKVLIAIIRALEFHKRYYPKPILEIYPPYNKDEDYYVELTFYEPHSFVWGAKDRAEKIKDELKRYLSSNEYKKLRLLGIFATNIEDPEYEVWLTPTKKGFRMSVETEEGGDSNEQG